MQYQGRTLNVIQEKNISEEYLIDCFGQGDDGQNILDTYISDGVDSGPHPLIYTNTDIHRAILDYANKINALVELLMENHRHDRFYRTQR